MARKFFAEFLGTAILVFVAVGVATLSFGFGADGGSFSAGVVATALAFGLTLLALAYVLGPISGCHVNPAVTLGALLAGQSPERRDRLLVRAVSRRHRRRPRLVGGLLQLAALPPHDDRSRHRRVGVGQSYPHRRRRGVLDRGDLTAVFVFVVLRVTAKGANAATAGVVIGLTLAVVHLFGIPVTGTSVNPARSLGPALIVGGQALSQLWLFIVAPLVGAVVAAGLQRVLVRD